VVCERVYLPRKCFLPLPFVVTRGGRVVHMCIILYSLSDPRPCSLALRRYGAAQWRHGVCSRGTASVLRSLWALGVTVLIVLVPIAVMQSHASHCRGVSDPADDVLSPAD